MTFFRLLHVSPLRVIRAAARVSLVAGALGLGFGPTQASGQETPDQSPSWTPGEEIEAEVRKELALRWEILPEALVLQWKAPRGGDLPSEIAGVQLLGTGRDGHWVASFQLREGVAEAQSALLRAGVLASLPVASHSLERGTVLGQEDMTLESRLHWGSPETLPQVAEIGWVAQRAIEGGAPLVTPTVKPPLFVVSGRPVTLVWSNGHIEVSLQGTAAGSASLGEWVLVRTDSGTRLGGLVEGPGRVRLQDHPTEIGK